MKIIDIDFKEDGKKYFCKDINEIFEVEEGNLIAATRNFSMAELVEMEFEEIKEVKNPYTRVNNRDRYYSIFGLKIHSDTDNNFEFDNELFSKANYFNNKEYAEYIDFKETLMRKLDKFAWENNAKVVNWDCSSTKHFIAFDNNDKELKISWCTAYQSNDIYFTSRKIAEQAIEEFKEDLIKLYTWKFDF